jgi:hypothetical protein
MSRFEPAAGACRRQSADRLSGNESWQKEYSHGSAVALHAECRAYCAFFQIQSPKLPRVPALDSDEMEVIRRREAQASAKKAEQTRIQREQQAEFERTKIERWRNGENVGYLYNVPVMLRVRTFGADESVAGEIGRVETSRGAIGGAIVSTLAPIPTMREATELCIGSGLFHR